MDWREKKKIRERGLQRAPPTGAKAFLRTTTKETAVQSGNVSTASFPPLASAAPCLASAKWIKPEEMLCNSSGTGLLRGPAPAFFGRKGLFYHEQFYIVKGKC